MQLKDTILGIDARLKQQPHPSKTKTTQETQLETGLSSGYNTKQCVRATQHISAAVMLQVTMCNFYLMK